jgi:hypothetical protein
MKKFVLMLSAVLLVAVQAMAAGVNHGGQAVTLAASPVAEQTAVLEKVLANPESLQASKDLSKKELSKFEKAKAKLQKHISKARSKAAAGDLGGLLTTIGLILIIVGLVVIVLGILGIGSTISGGGALVLGLILYLIGKFAL